MNKKNKNAQIASKHIQLTVKTSLSIWLWLSMSSNSFVLLAAAKSRMLKDKNQIGAFYQSKWFILI